MIADTISFMRIDTASLPIEEIGDPPDGDTETACRRRKPRFAITAGRFLNQIPDRPRDLVSHRFGRFCGPVSPGKFLF